MHPELEKLIAAIVEDGNISDKEREALRVAAVRLGISDIEADVYLDAAMARRRREDAGRTSSQDEVTPSLGRGGTNTCPACGAPIDSLLSACNFCGTAIQSRGMESLSDEQLIRKASEWIDKIPEGTINVSIGGKMKVMQRGEISGMAAQHLSVLKVRARSNPQIAETVRELELKYKRAKKQLTTRAKTLLASGLVVGLCFVVASVGADRAERKVDTAVKGLNVLESQIQNEISTGHYDAARSLVVQLEWTNADETETQNQDWSEKYAEKRRSYSEAIDSAEAHNRNR